MGYETACEQIRSSYQNSQGALAVGSILVHSFRRIKQDDYAWINRLIEKNCPFLLID